MRFTTFADHAARIEGESGDLETTALVTDLLVEAGPALEVVTRFVQGRIFPAWTSRTLDVGPSICYTAIARAAGPNVDADDVTERLAAVGDIGEVAAEYEFGGQRGLAAFAARSADDGEDEPTDDGEEEPTDDALTVLEVSEILSELADAEGSGSQDRKENLLFSLFNRCSSREARYLSRLVLSEMRIGVGEGTVRDAIAEAFDVPTNRVERALQVSNDYGAVARIARDEGVGGLDAMRLAVGRPIQAMLAQTGTVTGALDDWDLAAVEWKYDGARVQVHYDPAGIDDRDPTDRHPDDRASGEIDDRSTGSPTRPETLVFSRNMEDVTDALPEVVEFADEHLETAVILDGEVVAVDEGGNPLPFQEVLRRFRRKHDVEKAREDVAVRPVFFDCLHVDGADLLDEPLTARHDWLEDVLAATLKDPDPASETVPGLSLLWLTDDADEIESIDANALEAGHEGIMLKDPESRYSPGRRGKNWRKRKPDVETVDCVVTGAEWGEGRRATYLGTFELSIRDGDSFQTVGNVATGITDEKLAELTDLLEPHVTAESGKNVEVEPAVVFEVGVEEIQRSPTYSSGYALRFPRFLGVRHDKGPGDADSIERVERLRGS